VAAQRGLKPCATVIADAGRAIHIDAQDYEYCIVRRSGRRDGEVKMESLARDEDILKAAEDWRKAGRGVALATVVETWGSAPRPVGSNLVIDDQGNFLGSVSGGCVEGAVVTEAMDVIESGKPKTLEFGVADETAWKVGLSCGGTIRVYVEKVE
jgi:hypothetical protein